MCCRYWVDESPELRPFVEEMNRSPLTERFLERGPVTTQGEVRPTDVVPVIASSRRGIQAVFPMKWGFGGRTLLINARTETAAGKPAFRAAWESHRCIVPAGFYFEWEHLTGGDGKKRTGAKYMIRPKDSAVTYMCGLYRVENGLPAFVILTRESGGAIRFIHDRMPLMMPEDLGGAWIRPETRPEELLKNAVTDLLFRIADA